MRLRTCVACIVLLAPASASAQTTRLWPTIGSNAYNIELFQGPVLAPLRVTGLGGAYGPYAEGTEGIPANAAAPAVRTPYSVKHFDWDLAFSVSFPGAFANTDFDNDGRVGFSYSDHTFYTLGGLIQAGRLGIGVLGDFQRYNLTPNASPDAARSTLTIGRIHVQAGWAFFNNQLVVGAGIRGVWLSIDTSQPGHSQTLLRMAGASPEVGLLVRPDFQPWRIGATFRAPVRSIADLPGVVEDSAGVRRAAGLAVPNEVYLPWELQAGFAIQVGPRPINPKWLDPYLQEEQARAELRETRRARRSAVEAELSSLSDPARRERRKLEIEADETYLRAIEDAKLDKLHDQMLSERRARYSNWPRQYVLVVVDALVTGPSPQAIGLESFLSQEVRRSGESINVTPRLGLEGEPVINAIKTRIGSYVEPARYAESNTRQHFTFGFDVRIYDYPGWGILAPTSLRISAMADLAPRYQNLGVSIGAWH